MRIGGFNAASAQLSRGGEFVFSHDIYWKLIQPGKDYIWLDVTGRDIWSVYLRSQEHSYRVDYYEKRAFRNNRFFDDIVSGSSGRLNANNVGVVHYEDSTGFDHGKFVEQRRDLWEWYDVQGKQYPLEMSERDEWSVYLYCKKGKNGVQLDLYDRRVRVWTGVRGKNWESAPGEKSRDVYFITGANYTTVSSR